MTEQIFLKDIDSFIEEFLRNNPTFATFAGDHRFDALFGDYTIDAIKKDIRNMQRWLRQFEAFEISDWSFNNRIDCTLVIQILK